MITTTIISTLFGLISSALPSLIRYFDRRQELKYELEITKTKLEAAAKGYEISRDMSDYETVVQDGENVRDHDLSLDGNSTINILRASVRPIVTYTFFGLFITVKAFIAWTLIQSSGFSIATAKELSALILDEPTLVIFSTVLAFWFGARTFEKASDVTLRSFNVTKQSTSKSK